MRDDGTLTKAASESRQRGEHERDLDRERPDEHSPEGHRHAFPTIEATNELAEHLRHAQQGDAYEQQCEPHALCLRESSSFRSRSRSAGVI